MNFRSLIRFYWNHCITITCVFKLGGVYMSISHQVKWNATASILNIMASNYRSEFHFCLRDQTETHFCLRDRSEDFLLPPLFPPPTFPSPLLLFLGKVSNPSPLPWLFQTPPPPPPPRLFGTLARPSNWFAVGSKKCVF